MSLTIPKYIEAAGVVGAPITYKWEDDRWGLFYAHDNVKLMQKILLVSGKARLALATAIAEWNLWRLKGLSSHETTALFVEAVWASQVDFRYAVKWKTKDEPLPNGPEAGPL